MKFYFFCFIIRFVCRIANYTHMEWCACNVGRPLSEREFRSHTGTHTFGDTFAAGNTHEHVHSIHVTRIHKTHSRKHCPFGRAYVQFVADWYAMRFHLIFFNWTGIFMVFGIFCCCCFLCKAKRQKQKIYMYCLHLQCAYVTCWVKWSPHNHNNPWAHN